MTEAEERIIANYHALIDRAREITKTPPYNTYANDDFAVLEIKDDMAILSWPEIAGGYYNSYDLETQSTTFPAYLLTLTEEKFKLWQQEQTIKSIQEQEKEDGEEAN